VCSGMQTFAVVPASLYRTSAKDVSLLTDLFSSRQFHSFFGLYSSNMSGSLLPPASDCHYGNRAAYDFSYFPLMGRTTEQRLKVLRHDFP
jgi:hypothetical protein